MELHCKIVRNLSTYTDNHSTRHFKVNHIEYALERQFVEIETVAHIVVGRDCLRVIIDHYRLVPLLAGGGNGIDRAPVELDARADAVCSRAEDDY